MRLLMVFILFSNFISLFSQELKREKKSDKYGFVDPSQSWVIDAEYEDAWDFSKGIALVKKNGKWGYIDKTGKTVIPFELEKGEQLRGVFATVKKNNKYGLIDATGYFLETKFDNVIVEESWNRKEVKMIHIQQNGKWGLVDVKSGEITIQPQFDKIERHYNLKDTAYFYTENNLKGIINAKGDILLKAVAHKIIKVRKDHVKFSVNGKTGIVGWDNKILMEPKFDFIKKLNQTDATFIVSLDKRQGVYDVGKGLIIPIVYTKIEAKEVSNYDGWKSIFNEYDDYEDVQEMEDELFGRKTFYIASTLINTKEYYDFPKARNKIIGPIFPQKNGNIWAPKYKNYELYKVYDKDLNLISDGYVSYFKKVETSKGDYIITGEFGKRGVYSLQTKSWVIPRTNKNVVYNKGLDIFIVYNDRKTIISSDFKNKVENVVVLVDFYLNNSSGYFIVKEGEDKYVARIDSGTLVTDYKRVSSSFENGDFVMDIEGEFIPNCLTLSREGEKYFYSLIQEKEIGPIQKVIQDKLYSEGEYFFFNEILMVNGKSNILDEEHNLKFQEIEYFHSSRIRFGDSGADLIVFVKNGTSHIYDLRTDKLLDTEIEGPLDVEVIDRSTMHESDYEDEYGAFLMEYVYHYFFLVRDVKSENSHLILLDSDLNIITRDIDEYELDDDFISYKVERNWGVYNFLDKKKLEVVFRNSVRVDAEVSKELGRTIYKSYDDLYDPLADKFLKGYSFELDFNKKGKYVEASYYYYVEDNDEELISLFEEEYKELEFLSEKFDVGEGYSLFYAINKEGKHGVIDLFENIIIPFENDEILFDDDMMMFFEEEAILLLKKGKESTLFNLKTRKYIMPFAERTFIFNEDNLNVGVIIPYEENGKLRVVYKDNYTNEIRVLPNEYVRFELLEESYYILTQDTKGVFAFWGDLFNSTLDISEYKEDLDDYHWVIKNGKDAVVDKNGDAIVYLDETPELIDMVDPFTIICHYKNRADLYLEGIDDYGEEIDSMMLHASKENIMTPFKGYYQYYFYEDNNWWATNWEFKKEIPLGKKPPKAVFEINKQNIKHEVKGEKGILTNIETGVILSGEDYKFVSFKKLKGISFLYITRLKQYLDENFKVIKDEK